VKSVFWFHGPFLRNKKAVNFGLLTALFDLYLFYGISSYSQAAGDIIPPKISIIKAAGKDVVHVFVDSFAIHLFVESLYQNFLHVKPFSGNGYFLMEILWFDFGGHYQSGIQHFEQ
jgi:hypothetical protein